MCQYLLYCDMKSQKTTQYHRYTKNSRDRETVAEPGSLLPARFSSADIAVSKQAFPLSEGTSILFSIPRL